MTPAKREWSERVAPIVSQCRLSAALDMTLYYDARGATAIGGLLMQMAKELDDEMERQRLNGIKFCGRCCRVHTGDCKTTELP